MADDDKNTLRDIITELEADTVRLAWGRVALTVHHKLTVDALRALCDAHKACSELYKYGADDNGSPEPTD